MDQLEDGKITQVKPNTGHEGTRVDIIGERLLGTDLAEVSLAGVKATYKAGPHCLRSQWVLRVISSIKNKKRVSLSVVSTRVQGEKVPRARQVGPLRAPS